MAMVYATGIDHTAVGGTPNAVLTLVIGVLWVWWSVDRLNHGL
jgi:hypothetical protein